MSPSSVRQRGVYSIYDSESRFGIAQSTITISPVPPNVVQGRQKYLGNPSLLHVPQPVAINTVPASSALILDFAKTEIAIDNAIHQLPPASNASGADQNTKGDGDPSEF